HTVDDTEPKFGLAVTGVVHPERILTNRNARPGDALILTKPLGTGILSTALKRGALTKTAGELAVSTMAALNRPAAEAMQEVGVHACTDITGFGLLGHLLEMVRGAHCAAVVRSEKVPFLPEVQRLTVSNIIPGGTRDNFAYTAPFVEYQNSLSETMRLMLNDAQTSGGLLIALSEDKAEKLLGLLREKGVKEAAPIGRIQKQAQVKIYVE
ncbi:MAG TPA: selenide, water dikinase SelD, partial [Caldithrix sp.]|nr:selenide, water dikinase SelD [Caldithrix sp.]